MLDKFDMTQEKNIFLAKRKQYLFVLLSFLKIKGDDFKFKSVLLY